MKNDAEVVKLISAIPLRDSEIGEIADIIKSQAGKEIKIESHVDKSVIAGLYIRIGDKVFDSTIRSKLERLKDRLLP